METSYSALKEVSRDRQKCLETLLYIAEVEEYYQTLAAEVDNRSLQLSSATCPTDEEPVTTTNDGLSKSYNDCIYGVRRTWDWLSKSSRCMETHLRNAAAYHQFYHELRHSERCINLLASTLQKETAKATSERNIDSQAFNQQIRDVTCRLLEQQTRVSQLAELGKEVVPLQLRKQPLEAPVKATALVDYYQKDMAVTEKEVVEILDNSQPTKWKVRNSKGEEALLPAIIFLIPPPDKQVINESHRARLQLLTTWRDSVHLLTKRSRNFFTHFLEKHNAKDLECLSPSARAEVNKVLGTVEELLIPPDAETEADIKHLNSHIQQWHDTVGKMKGPAKDRRGMGNTIQTNWKGNQKVLKSFEELGAYVRAFEEEVDSTRGSIECLVRDKDGNVKFVSNAYIERINGEECDQVDNVGGGRGGGGKDYNDNEQLLTVTEKAPITEHLQHHSTDDIDGVIEEKVEVNEVALLKREGLDAEIIEEWSVQNTRNMSTEEFCSQTIRETKTFVIVGVIDPRTKETISIYKAISNGIISQTKGVYCNPEDGDTMPIPEAMNRGLILVEFTNSSIEQEALLKGILTTITDEEKTSYVVISVIDPVTGEKISVAEAIKRAKQGVIDQKNGRYVNPATGYYLAIAEAVEQGLLDVEEKESQPRVQRLVPKDYIISSVFDPRAHRQLPLEEALKRGLLDPENGVYIDPRTGKKIPIDEAIKMGIIRARLADPVKDRANPFLVRCRVLKEGFADEFEPEEAAVTSAAPKDLNVSIYSKVKEGLDPNKVGIVDPKSGHDADQSQTGGQRHVTFIPKGYEHLASLAKGQDPASPTETGQGSTTSAPGGDQQGIQKSEGHDPAATAAKGKGSSSSAVGGQGPNTTVEGGHGHDSSIQEDELKSMGMSDGHDSVPSIFKGRDPVRGIFEGGAPSAAISRDKELTIEEAFNSGMLHMNPSLHIQTPGGDHYNLHDAVAEGLLSPRIASELLKAIEPHTLEKLIEQGLIDPETGKYIDPKTGRKMSLSEAIKEGLLDPDKVFYMDAASKGITSLSSAIENGRFNPETGRFIDPKTGREMDLAEAVKAGLIEPGIEADKLATQMCSLKLLKDNMDTSLKGVKNTLTGENVSVEEAVLKGILDLPKNEYKNLKTGEVLPIPEAVIEGYIDPETAKSLYSAMGANSLSGLLAQNMIDPHTGKFIDPKTGKRMTFQQAIDAGLLDPNTVFFVDPATGEVTSLAAAIADGKFNPITGKFKDPLTGLEVSIANAIKNGVVEPVVDPEMLIETRCPVKDLLDGSTKHGGDPSDIRFVTPDGQEMSLKEALANGFITPDSIIKIDPKTGHVMIAGDSGDIVQALVDTKKKLDWVAGVETNIAKLEPPSVDAAELHEMVERAKDLQKQVLTAETPVNKLVGHAQDLLDNNRDAEKDASSKQQYQKLRFNTSDLKVRFQGLGHELDGRVNKLETIEEELSNYREHLDDLDTWLSSANQEMDYIKNSVPQTDETEELLDSFKDFNEATLSKEDDLNALTKAGLTLKDKAKDYEKDAEKFTRGLHQKVAASPPGAGGAGGAPGAGGAGDFEDVINDEIAQVSGRYQDVLANCDDLMAKLSETAQKNKQYNDLKSRLSESLPDMEARMREHGGDETDFTAPTSTAKAEAELEDLKSLTAEVISEGKLVDDLKQVGDDLIAILEDLDCKDTPKALEIQETCDIVASKFDAIQEELVDKQHKLNQALVDSRDLNHNLDALLGWVVETEALFDDVNPISLSREALNEQIQQHRMLVSDIENHKARVEQVAEQCRDSPAAADKVEQLVDRFDILESRAQSRGNELEDVVQKLGFLHGNVNQMEQWLGNAVNSLKRESSDFEPNSLREKIENLYRAKQGKQPELDAIKRVGRELIEDADTGDKHHLRETLADVQGKWHDLTELLVQMISYAALREIDDLLKYLDRAENEINTAEPISTDPETLAVQLRDHKAFHEDLEAKRAAVNKTIDKCNKMLRETTNDEADDIKSKLDSIRHQAELVCKLSAERLALLEEALPLASHFSETHADLQSWLGEIEAEIQSIDIPVDASAEQLRKQQDNAKTTKRIVEDHKPLVEDLYSTGQELMEMCTDEDASDVKEDVDHVNAKYDDVKHAIRDKLNDIDDALRNATTDVGDTIDGLLEELHYLNNSVEHADPIAANPESLREQISENNTFVDDLERRMPSIQQAKENVRAVLESQTPESQEEYEDLRSKLQELDSLQENISAGTNERAHQLDRALQVADKFSREYTEVIRALRDIQDNLLSQDSPGVDPNTVREQQKELQAIKEDLARAMPPLEDCRSSASDLESVCGTPGKMEIQKHLEDVDTALEDITDGIRDRQDELESALEKADRFDSHYQSIMSWLPKAEEKMAHLPPVAADPRSVRIQIEELKVFNMQVKPRYLDIQNLNQYASELKTASPVTAESLTPQVKEVNKRWSTLLHEMQDREQKLKESMVTLGEVDHAMDDVIGLLAQTESDIQELDNVFGDPKYIETHLKKLQYIIKDLKGQEPTIGKLNKAVNDMVAASGNKSSPLKDKQEEMNEQYKMVNITARDKKNQLQDILKEAKAFMGDVEDLIRWMGDFKTNLRSSAPMGALPDTAQKQFDKFMADFRELEHKEEEVQALLLNGEDMLARCRESDAKQFKQNLEKMKVKAYETKEKAEKKRRKMEEHLANVRDFHAMLKIHTDWLNNAEKVLGSFKHPSKIVEKVLQQIADHRGFRQDIEAHRDIMMNLDRTGTYLKYFGRKQDTVYIKNLLISIKLRWKKLVRRADEKGRLLHHAYKEDKRFYDAWKGLCDWLDDSERKLKKYSSNTPAKVKQDIDELKHFQHELSSKHPVYYSTMRLGRSLKDRCTKADPERDTLQAMLDDLKNKWTIIRSIIAQRQNKLDEALMSSGRFVDALESLLEWLGKAESYLSEDQPVLGDLDTVNILIEQHKAFQQELDTRQGMVQTMKAHPAGDGVLQSQIENLTSLWDRVNQLSEVREARHQEALKLAEEFNDSVQIVREWLPMAEAELKFKALPDDEDQIVNLIEAHDRFTDELRAHQSNIERIRYLADEILGACHPNAVRFVKYYLTITQTRWEQALNRADQRAQRLQEALRNIRGNAALLEELLAWLTEAQALLTAKEKDLIPEDLTTVEALVKEHLEFHDDLCNKNKDAERLTKQTNNEKKKQLFGSQYKLNESDSASYRVSTLQNKWRTVWRMSVERKKKLQDMLDHLLELESFKNFDFDLWRQRYVNWVRAKKLRITDFFRKQDKEGYGTLARQEFVDGMLSSKFPTNRTELNAVFDIFDRDGSGEIDYREFVDALRPERQRAARARSGKRPVTDAELISDEMEVQVSQCQCRQQFRAQKVGEGKYKMGEKQKMCLVRFLNNTVMVRVGGGWVTLQGFLEQNDPCKAKGRMNIDLRETLNFSPGDIARAQPKRRVSTSQTNGTPGSSRSATSSLNSSPSGSLTNLANPSSRRGSAHPLQNTANASSTPKPRRTSTTPSSRTPTSSRSTLSGKNTPTTPSSGRSRSPTSAPPSGAKNGTRAANGSAGGAAPRSHSPAHRPSTAHTNSRRTSTKTGR